MTFNKEGKTMSVWIHKLNEETNEVDSQLVPAKRLQGHLKAGWTTSPKGVPEDPAEDLEAEDTEKEDKESVSDTQEPEQAQDLSKLKVDELNALAEKAGVEGFANMKKAELVEALEPAQEPENEEQE